MSLDVSVFFFVIFTVEWGEMQEVYMDMYETQPPVANPSSPLYSTWAPTHHQDFAFNGNARAWVPENTHDCGLNDSAVTSALDNENDVAFNGDSDAWAPTPDNFFNAPPHGNPYLDFGPPYLLPPNTMQPSPSVSMPYYSEYTQQGPPHSMSALEMQPSPPGSFRVILSTRSTVRRTTSRPGTTGTTHRISHHKTMCRSRCRHITVLGRALRPLLVLSLA
jgi:hypothetical protein